MASFLASLLILFAVFVVLVLLLAVPLDLSFSIERVRNIHGQISVHWLFGAVRFRIPVQRTGRQQPEFVVRQQSFRKRSVRNKRRAHLDFVAILRQAPFRRRVYRFFKDLLHAVNLQRLRLLIRLGLGDPADTGRLWALLGPLSALAQNIDCAEVRIDPEFMDSILDVRADGQLRLIPLQILALTTAFVLSPPSIRAWRALRGTHA